MQVNVSSISSAALHSCDCLSLSLFFCYVDYWNIPIPRHGNTLFVDWKKHCFFVNKPKRRLKSLPLVVIFLFWINAIKKTFDNFRQRSWLHCGQRLLTNCLQSHHRLTRIFKFLRIIEIPLVFSNCFKVSESFKRSTIIRMETIARGQSLPHSIKQMQFCHWNSSIFTALAMVMVMWLKLPFPMDVSWLL